MVESNSKIYLCITILPVGSWDEHFLLDFGVSEDCAALWLPGKKGKNYNHIYMLISVMALHGPSVISNVFLLSHKLLEHVGARVQVDRILDSRSEALGVDSRSWPCVEVLGKLRIPRCLSSPSSNGYLVHRSKTQHKILP